MWEVTHHCVADSRSIGNASLAIPIWLLFSQASRTGSDLWLAWAAAHPASPSGSHGSSAVSATQFLQGLMGFAAASIVCALVGHLPAAVLVPYEAMYPEVPAVGLVLLRSVCTVQVRAFSFAYAGLVAAKHLHATLLAAVLGSPCAFFEQTPTGERLADLLMCKIEHCLSRSNGPRHTFAGR
jgi:hypothetical protein